MKIIIGKNAGFCGGVNSAIKQATEFVKQGPIYCLGEIVHNEQIVKELENKGMITVDSLEKIPNGATVMFRSHGEPISSYEKAKEKNLEIKDLTCPNVAAVHQKVEKAKEDSFVLIIGVKNHPEIKGTASFAGENSYVIETEDDILDAYMEYEKTNFGKIFVVSHTTFSSKKFDELVEEIEKNFCEAEIVVDKTICNSTENRQLEALKMAKNCDVMIIIGGKNSSNTKKLFEIAKENCQKSYCIQTVEDMKKVEFDKNDKIGIMAGASTPNKTVEEVKKYLERK